MQKSAFRVAKERARKKERKKEFQVSFLFLFVCSKESHKRTIFLKKIKKKIYFYLGVVPSGL